MTKMKAAKIVLLSALAFGGLVTTCTAVNHFWTGSRETRQIVTPDWYLQNYRFFVETDNAITQAKTNIESVDKGITDYKKDLGPRPQWTRTQEEGLQELEFSRRGYVSQCNLGIKNYRTKADDITRQYGDRLQPFVDGQDMSPYLDKKHDACV